MFRSPSAALAPDPCRVRALQEFLQREKVPEAQVAVTLGTGMQDLAATLRIEKELPFASLPGFPQATAPSHRGVVQWGTWHGVPTVVFVGRLHLYEGCAPSAVALCCSVAESIGTKALILTNAAGGLRPDMQVGDLMALDDHMNGQGLFCCRPVETPAIKGCDGSAAEAKRTPLPRCGYASVYSRMLVERTLKTADRVGVALHRGVYLGVPGPTYETRAEYRAFRRIGADAVGMSTTLEASAARSCGMHVLGFSMITNVARPDVVQKVAGEDVVAAAQASVPRLRAILDELFRERAFDDLGELPPLSKSC